jgi:hypothetical protein
MCIVDVYGLRFVQPAGEGDRGINPIFLDLGARRGGWSAPRPGLFTPGKNPVPIVQEDGWAPGPIWKCSKNLAPTEIRSPDRPARSQSLYRLSYPGPTEMSTRNNSWGVKAAGA